MKSRLKYIWLEAALIALVLVLQSCKKDCDMYTPSQDLENVEKKGSDSCSDENAGKPDDSDNDSGESIPFDDNTDTGGIDDPSDSSEDGTGDGISDDDDDESDDDTSSKGAGANR